MNGDLVCRFGKDNSRPVEAVFGDEVLTPVRYLQRYRNRASQPHRIEPWK